MKKLGIFLFNNYNGFTEDYINYLLEDLIPNLNHLCIIINDNELNITGLKKYTDDIYINNCHDNIELWKEVLVKHFGFDQLVNFDEIILFDDSFFGPIYSFKEIFNCIDNIGLDLWTILSNGVDDELNSCNFQFIAFRNNLIKSNEFKEFWKNINNYSLKNKNNENYLIHYFSKLGFKWKNYLDIINNFELDKNGTFFSIFDINNLVINYKLPLINIKPFLLSKNIHLKYHNGLDLPLVMDYLKKSNYNVSLIYRYLLKIIDPNSLVNILNLNKTFSLDNLNKSYRSNKSIVVIVHLFYDDLLDYDFKFLRNIPEYIDIIITTNEIDKKILIEGKLSKLKNNSNVILVNSRGRDMAGLFVGCKEIINNYDYFCFVHDKKSSQNNNYLVSSSFRDIIWENMLASEDYINSIIKDFDDNISLGLIVPPRVYHSAYFTGFYNNFWLNNVDELEKLFSKMDIDVKLDLNELPLSIGNCFWAKVDALKPIFDLNLNYEDFYPEPMPTDGTISHALERSYGHVAASQGYFTEIVMTEYYASNELTNYPYMFSNLLNIIRNRFDCNLSIPFVPFTEFLSRFKFNLDNLDKSIALKDKKIDEMINSTSWKLTKPLRSAKIKLYNLKK